MADDDKAPARGRKPADPTPAASPVEPDSEVQGAPEVTASDESSTDELPAPELSQAEKAEKAGMVPPSRDQTDPWVTPAQQDELDRREAERDGQNTDSGK